MTQMAEQALRYLQDNLLSTLIISVVAGFAGVQSVAPGKTANFFFYLFVGAVGSFLGQFAILYFGIDKFIDPLPNFRLLFDFIAAYLGSFALGAAMHFVKPM